MSPEGSAPPIKIPATHSSSSQCTGRAGPAARAHDPLMDSLRPTLMASGRFVLLHQKFKCSAEISCDDVRATLNLLIPIQWRTVTGRCRAGGGRRRCLCLHAPADPAGLLNPPPRPSCPFLSPRSGFLSVYINIGKELLIVTNLDSLPRVALTFFSQ